MLQAPEDFYKILFSPANLKVTFKKYRVPLEEKVPNGFDLANMDESELEDIVSLKMARKKILKQAIKLIQQMSPQSGQAPLKEVIKANIKSFSAHETHFTLSHVGFYIHFVSWK